MVNWIEHRGFFGKNISMLYNQATSFRHLFIFICLTSPSELRHTKESNEAHKIAVKDYQFTENMTAKACQADGVSLGFHGGQATGVNIMEAMIDDKKCVKILSFTADIIATGTRGVSASWPASQSML